MKIAIVGATGMVGQVMLKLLVERSFPITELLPVASARSAGKTISWRGREYRLLTVEEALQAKPDMALFSAGGSVSREWAPRFAQQGCTVIDNSSAWRMDPEVKLVVPEVNGDLLAKEDRLIANPNCSTIQLMMVLAPLQQRYGIRRVVVSTYQSVTGTGMAAVQQMENERAGEEGPLAYPYPIDQNCLPHCDTFDDNGYTREELKLLNESRKILQLPQLALTATAVRVPVRGGHSESVNLELEKEFHTTDLRKLLADQAGLHLQDHPDMNQYPMPRYAEGRDEVFVGRIRRDLSQINSLNLWIVADNLRKGAATNALQIAERLYALK
ncbi:MAG: aspartate-semialdehyde dehydrogenase, partial [Schleiferiaceae bacterium]|nr:aspartate-semialdehyde dehydrogenase [Schleiferiaceae bacterium]